jgi:hypothetical protein
MGLLEHLHDQHKQTEITAEEEEDPDFLRCLHRVVREQNPEEVDENCDENCDED